MGIWGTLGGSGNGGRWRECRYGMRARSGIDGTWGGNLQSQARDQGLDFSILENLIIQTWYTLSTIVQEMQYYVFLKYVLYD